MKIAGSLAVLFIVSKVVLDVWSAKKGMNLKFDIAYIVMLSLLGIITLSSNDPDSLLFGSLFLGASVAWGVWVYIKTSGLLKKFRGVSKPAERP